MKTDKRRTASAPIQSLKLFKVTFLEWFKGEEFLNVDSYKVLAITHQEAVSEAISKLDKKELKTYQVQEVELLNVID